MLWLFMHFISGSALSTAFSAAMLVASTVATPADTHSLEQPTAVMQPVKQAFTNAQMQECMLERRRMLYEARSNTLILSNIAATARQEVPTGPQFSV